MICEIIIKQQSSGLTGTGFRGIYHFIATNTGGGVPIMSIVLFLIVLWYKATARQTFNLGQDLGDNAIQTEVAETIAFYTSIFINLVYPRTARIPGIHVTIVLSQV